MDTFLSIDVFCSDEDRAKEVIEIAFNEIKRIEGLLSRFRKDSQIYKINNSAYIQPQIIDEELFYLIKDCLRFSKESGGAFDITIAPLIDLWSKAARTDTLPSQKEINTLLSNVGYQNIVQDKCAKTIFFKTPHLKIDLGAVGKGYALDRAVEVLIENEIKKARLDFGGQLYYFDSWDNLNEVEWVGIRDPLQPEEIIINLPLKNQSLSTSANYERNFKIQGRTYGHLIDPRSGYPVNNRIISVSVISNSCLSADILSTAVFILGLNEGMQLIDSMNEPRVIIITNNRGKPKMYSSQNLKEVICG